jgi:predicted 3-demethylubiquinone-9 3-methyltransferase (glyoxalase superfamily)/uncharacterized protein YndB with AHSA1/START domain
MPNKTKITPFLWFDNQAEEATQFYTSLFPDSTIGNIQYQGDKPMTLSFSLAGQPFTALNGGPMFSFNPSISFYVVCEDESEIDTLWQKLSEGGKAMMPLNQYAWSEKYGWIEDKYGISWQLSLEDMEKAGKKISPVLMFTESQHGKAEEAINRYISVFDDSEISLLARYEEGDDDPAIGTIKHARFRLGENTFMTMDSSYSHGFGFNEAISFVVSCETQKEVDSYWEKLTANGGEEMMCGWLKDTYGVCWQIVPDELLNLISGPGPERAQRAVGAMMQMRKINIEKIRQAAEDTSRTVITVQTSIQAPIEKVWEMWTLPEHIINWNFAIDAWQCPRADNDLRPGGKFNYRMEAKDGSMGFDYCGRYSAVNEPKSLEFVLDDGRGVQIHFSEVESGTFVMETFEAESSSPIEMQKGGWQAILNNFKRYVEWVE